ncbi:unnamed protein product, partial [Rotaria sp. Silwood1]
IQSIRSLLGNSKEQMSVYDSKANYHPVSTLPGSLPNGSYLLPGNGYYSVEGRLPRIRY